MSSNLQNMPPLQQAQQNQPVAQGSANVGKTKIADEPRFGLHSTKLEGRADNWGRYIADGLTHPMRFNVIGAAFAGIDAKGAKELQKNPENSWLKRNDDGTVSQKGLPIFLKAITALTLGVLETLVNAVLFAPKLLTTGMFLLFKGGEKLINLISGKSGNAAQEVSKQQKQINADIKSLADSAIHAQQFIHRNVGGDPKKANEAQQQMMAKADKAAAKVAPNGANYETIKQNTQNLMDELKTTKVKIPGSGTFGDYTQYGDLKVNVERPVLNPQGQPTGNTFVENITVSNYVQELVGERVIERMQNAAINDLIANFNTPLAQNSQFGLDAIQRHAQELNTFYPKISQQQFLQNLIQGVQNNQSFLGSVLPKAIQDLQVYANNPNAVNALMNQLTAQYLQELQGLRNEVKGYYDASGVPVYGLQQTQHNLQDQYNSLQGEIDALRAQNSTVGNLYDTMQQQNQTLLQTDLNKNLEKLTQLVEKQNAINTSLNQINRLLQEKQDRILEIERDLANGDRMVIDVLERRKNAILFALPQQDLRRGQIAGLVFPRPNMQAQQQNILDTLRRPAIDDATNRRRQQQMLQQQQIQFNAAVPNAQGNQAMQAPLPFQPIRSVQLQQPQQQQQQAPAPQQLFQPQPQQQQQAPMNAQNSFTFGANPLNIPPPPGANQQPAPAPQPQQLNNPVQLNLPQPQQQAPAPQQLLPNPAQLNIPQQQQQQAPAPQQQQQLPNPAQLGLPQQQAPAPQQQQPLFTPAQLNLPQQQQQQQAPAPQQQQQQQGLRPVNDLFIRPPQTTGQWLREGASNLSTGVYNRFFG